MRNIRIFIIFTLRSTLLCGAILRGSIWKRERRRLVVRDLSEAYDAWYDVKMYMPGMCGREAVEVCSARGVRYPEPVDVREEGGVVFVE